MSNQNYDKKRNFKGKNKKNWNNKKKSYQGKRTEERKDSEAVENIDGKTNPTNASWFWNRGVSYKEATKVPFDILAGTPLRLTNGESFIEHGSFPTVMTIGFVPCMGRALNTTDPINRAMIDLEAKLLASRTSPLPFTRSNLTMLYLNYSSIGMMLARAKRALETSYVYARDNVAFPQTLLRAQGFDPDSIIGKANDLIPVLNDLITWYNSFTLPNTYPIFQRHYELASNVYKDSYTGINGVQYYIFNPDGWYEYIDVSDTVDTPYLKWHNNIDAFDNDHTFNRTVVNPQSLMSYMDDIRTALQAWSDSSDFAYVRGAILNAMQKGVIKDPIISISGSNYLDPMNIVVDDKHILNSIHNMTMTPVLDLNVTEDPIRNVVVFDPQLDNTSTTPFALSGTSNCVPMALANFMEYDGLLDSLDGDTSDDFIMTATRLKIARTTDATDGSVWGVVCGTEIVTDAVTWRFEYTEASQQTPELLYHQFCSLGMTTGSSGSISAERAYAALRTVQELSAFQYAPLYVAANATLNTVSNMTSFTMTYRTWQVNYATKLTATQLSKLHTAALQSVFFPVTDTRK